MLSSFLDALLRPVRFVVRVVLEFFFPVFNNEIIEETPRVVERICRRAIKAAIEKHGLDYTREQFSGVLDHELETLQASWPKDSRLLDLLPVFYGFEVRDGLWKETYDAVLVDECRARGLIEE